jgi:RNA polymerase sigma-70 factor, ECF subfamily
MLVPPLDGLLATIHPMSDARSGRQAELFAMRRRGWLLTQARILSRNDSDAEDLVQETLLRFIQKGEVGALPDEVHWDGWLMKTLNNLFTDQCRRWKVQVRGAMDPNLCGEAVVQEYPVQTVYDSVTAEQIAQAASEVLSPILRDTFMMHMAGKKMSEIAEAFDIPQGVVRKRLYDARMKLRAFFQQHLSSGVH